MHQVRAIRLNRIGHGRRATLFFMRGVTALDPIAGVVAVGWFVGTCVARAGVVAGGWFVGTCVARAGAVAVGWFVGIGWGGVSVG